MADMPENNVDSTGQRNAPTPDTPVERPVSPPQPNSSSMPGVPRSRIPKVNRFRSFGDQTPKQRPGATPPPPGGAGTGNPDGIEDTKTPSSTTKRHLESNAKRLDITNVLLTKIMHLTEQIVLIMETDLKAATSNKLNDLRAKQQSEGMAHLKVVHANDRGKEEESTPKAPGLLGMLDVSIWTVLGNTLKALVIPFLIGFGLELMKHTDAIKKAKEFVTMLFEKMHKFADWLGDLTTKLTGSKGLGDAIKKLPELLLPYAALKMFAPRLMHLIEAPFKFVAKKIVGSISKFVLKPFAKAGKEAEGIFSKFVKGFKSFGKMFTEGEGIIGKFSKVFRVLGRLTGVINLLIAVGEGIKDFVVTLTSGKGIAEALRKGAVGVIDGLVGSWVKIIQDVLSGILKMFGADKLAAIVDKFDFKKWVGNITQKIGHAIAVFVEKLVNKFKEFTDGGFLSMLGKMMMTIPNAIFDMIKSLTGFDMKAYLIKLIDMLPAPAATVVKKLMGLYSSSTDPSKAAPNTNQEPVTRDRKMALLAEIKKEGKVSEAARRLLIDYNMANGNSKEQAEKLTAIDIKQTLAKPTPVPKSSAKAASGNASSAGSGSLTAALSTNRSTAAAIAAGESKSYDDWYKGGSNGIPTGIIKDPPKPLTSMTIGEVLDWQQQNLNREHAAGVGSNASSAAGKYQFVRTTLKDLYKKADLKLSDKFSQENQDKLLNALIGADVARYKEGKESREQLQSFLGHQFESLQRSSSRMDSVMGTIDRSGEKLASASEKNAITKTTASVASAAPNVTAVQGGNRVVTNQNFKLDNQSASTPVVFAPHVLAGAA